VVVAVVVVVEIVVVEVVLVVVVVVEIVIVPLTQWVSSSSNQVSVEEVVTILVMELDDTVRGRLARPRQHLSTTAVADLW